ncbi:MAG: nucleotidyltransferase family protein [Candidatus Bipolaricaulota bacterium]|nr:nucleotidyltransferase family protein [Candidatus Bipolaricaulota bacterium]
MIAAIVLAAGKGERYGAIKPLIQIEGEPALSRIVKTLRAAGVDDILVVLGHAAETISREVDLGDVRVLVNPNYKTGMGGSLSLGIRSLPPSVKGFLILHADMPYVSQATLRSVLARADAGALIAAPIYRGRRGFPVYLHRSCCPGLLQTLHGEMGARGFIALNHCDLTLTEVDDPGCVWDIDRPEDLRNMEEKRRAAAVFKG